MPPGKDIALIIYALVFVLVSSLLMCICPYSKLKYLVRISGERERKLVVGLSLPAGSAVLSVSLSWAAEPVQRSGMAVFRLHARENFSYCGHP